VPPVSFHLYVLSDNQPRATSQPPRKKPAFRLPGPRKNGADRIPVTYRPPRPSTPASRPEISFWDFLASAGAASMNLRCDARTPIAFMTSRCDHADGGGRDPGRSKTPAFSRACGWGLPSTSGLSRAIFPVSVWRLGMRSWTIGSRLGGRADCGPYWGHKRHHPHRRRSSRIAHIPKLPEGGVLGGHVLSHDQIEGGADGAAPATMVRRAAGRRPRLGRKESADP